MLSRPPQVTSLLPDLFGSVGRMTRGNDEWGGATPSVTRSRE